MTEGRMTRWWDYKLQDDDKVMWLQVTRIQDYKLQDDKMTNRPEYWQDYDRVTR